MIGTNSPVWAREWQGLAHFANMAMKWFRLSTGACIAVRADLREYPRVTSVITIRTPSPGGLSDVSQHRQPAFFVTHTCRHVVSEIWNKRGILAFTSRKPTKGCTRCSSINLPLPLRHSQHFRPVVTPLANKRLAVQQSAPVPQSSQMTALQKGRPLALQATSPTASFIRQTATNRARHSALIFPKAVSTAVRTAFLRSARYLFTQMNCQKRTANVQ